MRIPPQLFSDDSQSEAEEFPVSSRCPAELEDTHDEGTLKLPGVDLAPASPQMVSLPLGEILGPLSEAIRSNRTFLSDFAEDEVQLPADLVDCLKAFEQMGRAA